MRRMQRWMLVAAGLAALSAGAQDRKGTPTRPPGAQKTDKTKVLGLGAQMLQDSAPPSKLDMYLVGFHPMKADPGMQMEAHHFCHQVNQDFAQCALFDGNTEDANLNGIEYIISEKLFEGLPEEEKAYWHPHNYEIFSGQLVAPGIPSGAEKALMKDKVNSYGKTWHVWHTGSPGRAAHPLPTGPAMLAWSFNRDGEAQPGLAEERDRKMGIDSQKKRTQRADLAALARPQRGVDDLKAAFPQATGAPKGVQGTGPAGGAPRCEMKPVGAGPSHGGGAH
jgi:hypothetical protein